MQLHSTITAATAVLSLTHTEGREWTANLFPEPTLCFSQKKVDMVDLLDVREKREKRRKGIAQRDGEEEEEEKEWQTIPAQFSAAGCDSSGISSDGDNDVTSFSSPHQLHRC
jgi:hypothetical protein